MCQAVHSQLATQLPEYWQTIQMEYLCCDHSVLSVRLGLSTNKIGKGWREESCFGLKIPVLVATNAEDVSRSCSKHAVWVTIDEAGYTSNIQADRRII